MKTWKLLALLGFFCGTSMLVSCGDDDEDNNSNGGNDTPAAQVTNNTIAGTWTANTQKYENNDLVQQTTTVNLTPDGTIVIYEMTVSSSGQYDMVRLWGTYSIDGSKMTTTMQKRERFVNGAWVVEKENMNDTQVSNFEFKGESFTISINGDTMTFNKDKDDDDEQPQQIIPGGDSINVSPVQPVIPGGDSINVSPVQPVINAKDLIGSWSSSSVDTKDGYVRRTSAILNLNQDGTFMRTETEIEEYGDSIRTSYQHMMRISGRYTVTEKTLNIVFTKVEFFENDQWFTEPWGEEGNEQYAEYYLQGDRLVVFGMSGDGEPEEYTRITR